MSKNVSFFGKFQVRFGRAEMSLLEMFQWMAPLAMLPVYKQLPITLQYSHFTIIAYN